MTTLSIGPLPAWMDHPDRPCAVGDPDAWFKQLEGAVAKNTGKVPSTRAQDRARALCHGCPVLDECREYAIEDASLEGIWGGTTPTMRRAVRKAAGT